MAPRKSGGTKKGPKKPPGKPTGHSQFKLNSLGSGHVEDGYQAEDDVTPETFDLNKTEDQRADRTTPD